jgi:hypothetical protein
LKLQKDLLSKSDKEEIRFESVIKLCEAGWPEYNFNFVLILHKGGKARCPLMDLDANERFLGFTYTVMTKSNFGKMGR